MDGWSAGEENWKVTSSGLGLLLAADPVANGSSGYNIAESLASAGSKERMQDKALAILPPSAPHPVLYSGFAL